MGNRTKNKKPIATEYKSVNGHQVVVLDMKEYQRLKQIADEWEPSLPAPDRDGQYPAVEYARVSLARKIIRRRRRLQLTQAELAERAGIRQQTLNRIESGEHSPAVATVEKIERALQEAREESAKGDT